MADVNGKWYYKGNDGLEYATIEDARKYGGGVVGKRFHQPMKIWEPVYEEMTEEAVKVNAKAALGHDTPQAVTEYDNMDIPQLKEVLRAKGYAIKGNPKRETIIEKLKSLNSILPE